MTSGIALVAVVGWGLIRSSNDARERAAWAARSDARDLALALRSALRHPAIIKLCAPKDRFVVADGEVQIDANIGWLTATTERPFDSLWQEQLTRTERAEFVEHDAALASQHFDELLLRLDEQDRRTLPIVARAAWQAHRANDDAKAEQLLERLDAPLAATTAAALGDPHVANALASATLLAAALGHPPSEARWQQLLAMPTELANATLRRLAEFAVPTNEQQQLLVAHDQRRQKLQHAATFVRKSAQFGPVQASDGQLVLWHAGEQPGTGFGAIVDPQWLLQLPGLGTTRATDLDLPPIPDRGRVTLAAEEAAEPILTELAWAVPPPQPVVTWLTQPTALLAAGFGLLLLFGGTVWTTMRGLARETAAMRTRTEFLSGVTHELKTPVAAMRLIADVLHDDEVDPARQRQYFAMMAAEAARLSALIDNVLDLGQMERGERAYDLRPGDAAMVVREAVASYRPLGIDAGLAIELQEGVTEAFCTIDSGAITQALLNLLENARKYASGGHRIDIQTQNGDGNFTVLVRDYGPGVPVEERERIFARFQRGRAQLSGSIAGVGLGLFLSRSILEHHRGTLTCHAPTEGQGAVFQLTLPLQPSP